MNDLQAEQTPQMILDRINQFNEQYPSAAYSFAHIVLEETELSNKSIEFCFNSPLYHDWLKQQILDLNQNLPAPLYTEAVAALFNLREDIANLLRWLTHVSENVREQAMELQYGEVIE